MIIPLNGRDFFEIKFPGPVDRRGETDDGRVIFFWSNVEIFLGDDAIEISDDTSAEIQAQLTALIEPPPTRDYEKMKSKIGPLIQDLVGQDILQMDAAGLRKLLFLLLWQQKAITPEIDAEGTIVLLLKNPKEWMRRYSE